MPKSLKRSGYMKCYSFSSPRSIKSLRNPITDNYQKSCSQLRRPEPILEIRKRTKFLEMLSKPNFYKYFKEFNNHKRKLTELRFLAVDLPTRFLNAGTADEVFQQSGKQDSFRQILKSSASLKNKLA